MANSIPKAKPQKNATPNGAVIHKKSLQTRIAENWQYYILILPAIVYVAIWCYTPMYGLQIAFKDFKFSLGITGSRWIGFRHFTDFFKGYYFKTLLENTFAISLYSLVVGFPVPIIVALILVGGVKRIGKVTEKLVPLMALLYIILGIGLILIRFDRIGDVLVSIFQGAFQPAAVTGGVVGSFFLSMQKGVSRGIFSNEAGLGTGSIAHACADTDKPVEQGMFGIFEVFMDTIVICTMTALVILLSGVSITYGEAAGAELTIAGFTLVYGNWVSIFTAVAMCCFAFSTILGWGLYGSRCMEFLFGHKIVKPYIAVYALVAIVGATLDLDLIWGISDTSNGFMAIPNLIALFLLAPKLFALMKKHFNEN